MSNLNEERMRKFRDMGIPMPMAPVDPALNTGSVKNTEFAKKLAAIKNGTKKEELNTFIEKEKAQAGFMPLELPAKKSPNGKPQNQPVNEGVKKPAISGPSFDAYEKALYGDSSVVDFHETHNPTVTSRNYSSDIVTESTGSEFIHDIRNRLAEKFTRTAAPAQKIGSVNGQVVLNENNSQNIPNGYKLINENELKETITSISSQLIKKFMAEFLTSEPGLIKESEKIKKAEIVKEDIVKIDGKFFKLTPVTLKKK